MRMRLFGLLLAAFLLAASPAFAQNGDDVQYTAACQNIIGSIGAITQTQNGAATAIVVDEEADDATPPPTEAVEAGDAESRAEPAEREAAEAEPAEGKAAEEVEGEDEVVVPDRGVLAMVAQEQGVTIAQVNDCLNGVDDTDTDDTDTNTADGVPKDVLTSTIPDQKVLANTGGPALLLPALGLLLISSVVLRNLLQR